MSPSPFAAEAPPVGHVLDEFLTPTETFIYTIVRCQHEFSPVVLAGERSNPHLFPFEPVHELRRRDATATRRVLDRLSAHAAGFRTTIEWRTAEEARRARCVLLHAHLGVPGYLSLAAGRRLKIPLITTFYGRDLCEPQRRPGWARRYARLFAEGTLFTCEGPAMANHLERIGCPPEKIRVVRIGVDISSIPFRPRRPERHLTLIQAARLAEKKGVDVTIRAFAAARDRSDRIADLILVGDGPERSKLEVLASQLGVAEHVRFLGALTIEDYHRQLEQAHIGVQPSRMASDGDTEGGAPTVVIEMQAGGLPVVASRHADLPFVVAHADHLVEEEDATAIAAVLLRLADEPPHRWAQRATEARAFVEAEHDAALTARRIADVYREALHAGAAADAGYHQTAAVRPRLEHG